MSLYYCWVLSYFFFLSSFFLFFSFEAVLKSLSPVDPVEPISNSEPSMDSDMGKMIKIGKNDTEEENSKPSTTDSGISSRTEYLCENPLDGKST